MRRPRIVIVAVSVLAAVVTVAVGGSAARADSVAPFPAQNAATGTVAAVASAKVSGSTAVFDDGSSGYVQATTVVST